MKNETIIHLSDAINNEVSFEWVDPDKFDVENDFNIYSGLWVASGSPYN